jgi:hypothetical protein
VDKEYAEQMLLQGRAHMSQTLGDARRAWEARTLVSGSSSSGGGGGACTLGGLVGISESRAVVRATRTVACAPSMEQRLGPRVLPER